jgi:aminoglycoside phosphotransferase (APT) family kinase protein
VSALENPLAPLDAPLRFVHQDLGPEHFIVDPASGRLAGILDWTDGGLGDAARDFVTLVTFGGWDFADQALASYRHELDNGFRERLRFMARFLSVMWLGEAVMNAGDVAKHVTWVRNAFA